MYVVAANWFSQSDYFKNVHYLHFNINMTFILDSERVKILLLLSNNRKEVHLYVVKRERNEWMEKKLITDVEDLNIYEKTIC